ncbi:uncharacterized protein [Amphiura filiformis]|uniref:uncharacterized protein n=1 Tax=Amphiura filiformis TaxID=82378 RepID=UPI003B228B47
MAEASPTRQRDRPSLKSFVNDFLTCKLCEELYNETDRVAKVLTCMHTFCNACLDKLLQDLHVRCPYCKRRWALPEDGFPNHYMVEDLKNYQSLIREPSTEEVFSYDEDTSTSTDEVVKCSCCPVPEEANQAVAYCEECAGHVCQTCIEYHKNFRHMKGHHIQNLSELRGRVLAKSRCSIHADQDVTVYCTTCQRALCNTCCALTTHDGHPKIDLKVAMVDTKRELRVLAERGREKQEPLNELLTSIDATINELNMLFSSREDEIQTLVDELEKMVKVQCEHAKTLLRELCLKKTKRLQKQKHEVESRHTEYESACEFAEQACKVANPIQLLAAKTQISSRLNDLIDKANDLPDLIEPVENSYVPFQESHVTALQEFKHAISQLGIVQSTSTLPSLCRVSSLPSGDLTPGETEFVLLYAGSVDPETNLTGGDPFTAQLTGPDGSRQECKIIDHKDGSYDVAYTPVTFGTHTLDIRLFDRPVRGSPFEVNVESNSLYRVEISDSVTWLPAVAGFPHTVNVTLLPEEEDKHGEDLAKVKTLQAEIQSSSGYAIPTSVRKDENDDYMYAIQYLPQNPEPLSLHIKSNGHSLTDSPYSIDVSDLSKEHTEITLGTPVVNQRWIISVTPKNHLGRPVPISHTVLHLKVTTLRQNKDLRIEAHHVTSDHVHVFHCIPHKVGIHQVDAQICGVSIHGKAVPINVENWMILPIPQDKENSPTSVATSSSGLIFLSDTKVGSIHVHNTDGTYSYISVNMHKNSSIAVDRQGRLLLLVSERKRVHVYEQGQAVLDWKCTKDNARPVSLACSRHEGDDTVVIADASPDFNGLFLYKSDGTPIKCISLSNSFIIEGHDSICTDDRHHIFICHSSKAKVIEFNFDGLFIREFPTEVKGQQLAITSTPDGFLLVSEKGRVVILDLRTGFSKYKGDIIARGDSYSSMAATNDGCVIGLDVSQKRLIKYGYLLESFYVTKL